MKSIVISLDFEARWGVLDHVRDDMSAYRRNLEGEREAVPAMLELFAKRGVRATWAIVGALACEGWDEWETRAPRFPRYEREQLRWSDTYKALDPRGELYFLPKLVEQIRKTKGQELGSHTFSHVYFREPGFTREDAEADTAAVERLFRERWRARATSFVFPRNQVEHVDVLSQHGITSYRLNPTPFWWNATASREQSKRVRALRLADAVLPLGRRGYAEGSARASHFIRFNLPEPLFALHLRRVAADAMALRDGEALHVWWHPHNLGHAPAASVDRLRRLLDALEQSAPTARFATMADAA